MADLTQTANTVFLDTFSGHAENTYLTAHTPDFTARALVYTSSQGYATPTGRLVDNSASAEEAGAPAVALVRRRTLDVSAAIQVDSAPSAGWPSVIFQTRGVGNAASRWGDLDAKIVRGASGYELRIDWADWDNSVSHTVTLPTVAAYVEIALTVSYDAVVGGITYNLTGLAGGPVSGTLTAPASGSFCDMTSLTIGTSGLGYGELDSVRVEEWAFTVPPFWYGFQRSYEVP